MTTPNNPTPPNSSPAATEGEVLNRWQTARDKLAAQDTSHDLHHPVAAKVRKQLIAIHDIAIADLSALRQELSAARGDKELLDWLEKGGMVSSWEEENDQGEKTGRRYWELPNREVDECFQSARQAIRAAMQSPAKGDSPQ